jgi:Xaa-Pro dipeptidase
MSLPDADRLYPAHLATTMARTDRALAAGRFSALIAAAGTAPMQFMDDQPYPYKVSPQFKAWAPLTHAPGSYVVYRPGERPKLLFLQPEDYWHKPPSLPEEPWINAFDVTVIREAKAAHGHFPARAVYLGPPDGAVDWPELAVNPTVVVDMLDYARAVKTDYEIACMRHAAVAAARGHQAAASAFHSGASEYATHLAYLAASDHQEQDLPYPNIIGQNEAAAVLHYTDLRHSAAAPLRSLLIDAGAQYRGYAADVTRTYCAEPRALFADLITAMDALQQRLCGLVRPGVPYPDIQLEAHRQVADLLHTAGIIRCSAELAVETGLSAVFFPHGVGHLLGLQVHDVGGFMASEQGGSLPRPPGHPYLRLTRVLEAGVVVTIEPGIYFIDLLLEAARGDGRGRDIDWAKVDALRPYGGIRIEDDVVALEAGPLNLTRAAFTEISG